MSNDPMGNPPDELLRIQGPDTQLLPSDEQHPELPNWREAIKQKVAAFIDATGRIVNVCYWPSPNILILSLTSFFSPKVHRNIGTVEWRQHPWDFSIFMTTRGSCRWGHGLRITHLSPSKPRRSSMGPFQKSRASKIDSAMWPSFKLIWYFMPVRTRAQNG